MDARIFHADGVFFANVHAGLAAQAVFRTHGKCLALANFQYAGAADFKAFFTAVASVSIH